MNPDDDRDEPDDPTPLEEPSPIEPREAHYGDPAADDRQADGLADRRHDLGGEG